MERYLLMHKNVPVAQFNLDAGDANAKPKQIYKNQAAIQHLPIGAQMNDMKFIEWWQDRSIPRTRQGARGALERLGYKSVTNALIDNLALSLNDCYWIKPITSDLSWENVNLFVNEFEDTFGELTFNKNSETFDLRSKTKFNCATTQGEVQKKWCIESDGKRCLIKGNYGNSYQQSINEVFATKLHQTQRFENYTPYYFVKVSLENNLTGLGCKSYNFCNEQVEAISAWEILQTLKMRQNMSLYQPFREVCLKLGMNADYFDYYIDYEIMTDFLLTNTDRHMNNISILRNPDSLELIGFAPIYDSGNSMFYSVPTNQLNLVKLGRDKVHSFVTSREVNLLKYVRDRNIVDLSKINVDFSIYQKDVEPDRWSILKEMFYRKIETLRAFQLGKNPWESRI